MLFLVFSTNRQIFIYIYCLISVRVPVSNGGTKVLAMNIGIMFVMKYESDM